jgi:mono/diheme cytochrome c family protein
MTLCPTGEPIRRTGAAPWLGMVLASMLAPFMPASAQEQGHGSADALSVLEAHCVKCHGGEKTKGGLDLTSREALLRGGEGGASVVPGKPEASLLVQMIRHEKDPGMPYKLDKLAAADIEKLSAWVKEGVPYPRAVDKKAGSGQAVAEFTVSEKDRQHWSFQPVKKIAPPQTKKPSWARNPIDQFILTAMEAKGVAPAPQAGKEPLIRRLTIDLIGLPPTPAEIDAFVQDTSANAYEKLIDRLLASPHYGERWGRHWLDLARYGETDGFEHDTVRPHAWRYRDYVIQSLNQDKPYDRFIREQLAGDELYPDDPDALIATGFNLLGPDMVDSSDQVMRRQITLNDMTDTASFAFLGLSLACARCHDHKFEPLSQKDYYQLQAFFTPLAFKPEFPIPTPQERTAYHAAMAKYNDLTRDLQEGLARIEGPRREKLFNDKLAKLSEEAQQAHRTPKDQRTTEQDNLVQETITMVEFKESDVLKLMSQAEKDEHARLKEALKKFPKPAPPRSATVVQTVNPSAKTFVLGRGEPSNRGDEVQAGFPTVLGAPQPSLSSGRRVALAEWITNPANPLTARVMVNRIWQHHFGRGLVGTPSDFGTRGEAPSHPELLDWLAAEFPARGWSLKQMHKLMLLSAAYQQSSQISPETLARDPDNRLFSRHQRQRLEGEVIRDSLLAISGELNPKLGGPGVFPPIPEDVFKGAKGWTVSKQREDHMRRSVYIFARRNLRFPLLEVFDAPDSNLSCPERGNSTTAPQSLTLLNADEVMAATKAVAARLKAATPDRDGQITQAYRLILGRHPTAKEMGLSQEFLQRAPLTELCRALFNLNGFLYAD